MNAVTGKPWKGLLALLIVWEAGQFLSGSRWARPHLACNCLVLVEFKHEAILDIRDKVSETCHKCST